MITNRSSEPLNAHTLCMHLQSTRWLVVLGACFGPMAACAHTTSAVNAPPPTAAQPVAAKAKPLPHPPPPAQAATFESFMAEHAVILTWARNAVMAGDLDQLREPLTALAAYRYDDVAVGRWLPFMTELQQAASLTARANTIEVAAAGVATMGRICGECHRSTGGGPALETPHDPYGAGTQPFVDRMLTHAWAVDQLWQGLITPSDVAWNAGAKSLAQLSTKSTRLMPKSYETVLSSVQRLGAEAVTISGPTQRADLYGLLLATCGECHADTVDHAF